MKLVISFSSIYFERIAKDTFFLLAFFVCDREICGFVLLVNLKAFDREFIMNQFE